MSYDFSIDPLTNLINEGKSWVIDTLGVQDTIDEMIADIKDSIGRFYTFEKKIVKLGQQIKSGNFDANIINKYSEIQSRQIILQAQVDDFVNMTGSAINTFGDFEFNMDYLKSKSDDIQSVVIIASNFLIQTAPMINLQEKEISNLNKLINGETSELMLKVQDFLSQKKNWLYVIGGIWVVKKIL